VSTIAESRSFILYATPNGVWRHKKITRMKEVHRRAYAQYRPALIHKGGKP